MSVLTIAEGDLFTFRVVKHLSTNPDNKWANSYEFEALSEVAESELLGLGGILVNYEQSLHLGPVTFDRLLISTWAPDSVPYNPESFVSTSLTAAGTAGRTGDPLSLDKAFSVTRQARSGRFGHLFYRGVLVEPDVEAPAGKSVLVDRSGYQDDLQTAISTSGLEDYIGTSPVAALHMVMVSRDGSQVRGVTGLFAQGVATVKTDHKWFNRSNPV